VLGDILEQIAGEPLDVFARRRIFEPLGMRDTLYCPEAALLPRIAPTEQDPWRGTLLRGQVHDENAYALGGVAPARGPVQTPPSTSRASPKMLLRGGVSGGRASSTRRRSPASPAPSTSPAPRAPSAGTRRQKALRRHPAFRPAFGHTGFTGTSSGSTPGSACSSSCSRTVSTPLASTTGCRKLRPAVMDAVVRALVPPLPVGLDGSSPRAGGR